MPQNNGNDRYGFNGEPLSFTPDRTANGTVRRTRTDNSIEFPSQQRMTRQENETTRGSRNPGTAQRPRTAGTAARRSGTAPKRKNGTGGKRRAAALKRPQNAQAQRMRPVQTDRNRDPVRREKRKQRKMTRAAIKRRRTIQRLVALGTLLAVIAAGVYLTMTMLFRIGTIQVQTADGTAVQEAAGYTSDQILQALGVQLEENIFGFDPAAKQAALEKQFPLLESIQVVREYPNTVVVKVTEAVPAYAMQTKSGWLTLSDKFKILACDADQPAGLKTLYGGEPVSVQPGDQLAFELPQPAADPAASDSSGASSEAQEPQEDGRLAALAELQTKLEEYGMLDDVTRIEFADTDQMAFLYQDRISVLLGTLNDLDYKLDRARYVLTNADGKGVSATDTGGLDFSHVSASSTTRKFYLAQGQPTLPSGYVVPEPAEPEQPDTADEADGTGEDAAAQPAPDAADTAEETPLTDPARMTANEDENPM